LNCVPPPAPCPSKSSSSQPFASILETTTDASIDQLPLTATDCTKSQKSFLPQKVSFFTRWQPTQLPLPVSSRQSSLKRSPRELVAQTNPRLATQVFSKGSRTRRTSQAPPVHRKSPSLVKEIKQVIDESRPHALRERRVPKLLLAS
jgi:hypothetical protein